MRVPSLHETDGDARLLCAPAWSLGTGHERLHQWSTAAIPSRGHMVYAVVTCGDHAGTGDLQRSAAEDPELAQSTTCISPPVALGS
jgi:hypothetical protein